MSRRLSVVPIPRRDNDLEDSLSEEIYENLLTLGLFHPLCGELKSSVTKVNIASHTFSRDVDDSHSLCFCPTKANVQKGQYEGLHPRGAFPDDDFIAEQLPQVQMAGHDNRRRAGFQVIETNSFPTKHRTDFLHQFAKGISLCSNWTTTASNTAGKWTKSRLGLFYFPAASSFWNWFSNSF